MLQQCFFAREPLDVAQDLLGKILMVKYNNAWLAARIIETEAYSLTDKGSHASLGFTEKRKALFMQAGTIYMYYARGGDSLNFSCHGEGNAVLIKSAFPYQQHNEYVNMIRTMQRLNPNKNNNDPRHVEKLCSGQTLLCKSLNLKVPEWDQQQFDKQRFYVKDVGDNPKAIIQTTRLGIPSGRDEDLHYRFIDFEYTKYCTQNPLTKRNWQAGQEYRIFKR